MCLLDSALDDHLDHNFFPSVWDVRSISGPRSQFLAVGLVLGDLVLFDEQDTSITTSHSICLDSEGNERHQITTKSRAHGAKRESALIQTSLRKSARSGSALSQVLHMSHLSETRRSSERVVAGDCEHPYPLLTESQVGGLT